MGAGYHRHNSQQFHCNCNLAEVGRATLSTVHTQMLLELRNLNVNFGAVCAVRDVSFGIAEGEVLGLVGESGSGKSVTSLAILRLLPATAKITG
jgi:ABC-type multidrug transport system fused ATPase/permease subunit